MAMGFFTERRVPEPLCFCLVRSYDKFNKKVKHLSPLTCCGWRHWGKAWRLSSDCAEIAGF